MALPRFPNLETSSGQSPPAEYFHDDSVRIIVGREQERFEIPKRLLCHYSAYFAVVLNTGHLTREVHLPTDTPEIFQLFHTWIHTQHIPDVPLPDNSDHEWHDLSHLYVFADMRLVPFLKNDIIDRLLAKYHHYDFRTTSLLHIAYIYDNTPASSALRKLVADLFSCTPHLDQLSEDDTRFLLTSTSKDFLWDLIHSLFETREPVRTLNPDLVTCIERTETLDENATQAFLDSTPSGYLWDTVLALYESRKLHLPRLEMADFRREGCRYHEHRRGERCPGGGMVQVDVVEIGRDVERMTLDGGS